MSENKQVQANKQVVYKRPLISNKNISAIKDLIIQLKSYQHFYNNYKISFEIDEDVNVEIRIRLNINDKEVVLEGVDIDDMSITVDNFFLGMKTYQNVL